VSMFNEQNVQNIGQTQRLLLHITIDVRVLDIVLQ
jgi:hypothetical protein